MAKPNEDERWLESEIDNTLLWQSTNDYVHFVQAVAEGTWNEVDHGATRVFVQFVKNGDETDLYVFGNGEGVDDEGMRAIVSLMKSPSRRSFHKRGKKGTGSKAFCRHAKALTVQTICRGESRMWTTSYTTKELRDSLHGRQKIRWQRVEVPAGCKIKGHGTCFIWHGLGKGEAEYVNASHPRTVSVLIEEIAQRLPRDVAKMVTVVSTRGNPTKPVERELAGEIVEGTTTLAVLGAAAFRIGVTKTVNQLDRLKIWARDPACTINVFLSNVRRTAANAGLVEGISRALDDPRVIGEISIPALNEYILRQSGAGFRQDLYDDEDLVFIILNWLYSEVCPPVEALLNQEPEAQKDCDAMRALLVKDFQELGDAPEGPVAPPPVDPDALSTDPSRITGEPGDEGWIQIKKPREGASYLWDDSNAGLVLKNQRGPRVHWTLGNRVGSYSLILREGDSLRKITVEIPEWLRPTVPSRARHGVPGQKIHHKLIHAKHIVGMPTWKTSEDGGLLQSSADGLEVDHTLPDEEGLIDVWVEADLDNGEKLKLKIVVEVRRHTREPNPPRGPQQNEFIYNGHTYVLAIRQFSESGIPSTYSDTVAGGNTRLTLNFGAAEFRGNEALRRRAARLMITRLIAEDEFRRNPKLIPSSEIADTLRHRAFEIYSELAARVS